MKLLLSVLFVAMAAILLAQSTLVRSATSGTSGPINDLASIALSNGMTTIYAGTSSTGVGSVSVLRYTSAGGQLPIESTSEVFPGESVTGVAGHVDSIGKYYYIFSYVDGSTTRLAVRGSSEALGGPVGGWTLDLGPNVRGVPSICDAYDASLLELLVPTSAGYRLIYIKKSNGALAMDRSYTEPSFDGTALLRSSSDGRTCVLFRASSADTTLICYDKAGGETWRKTVPALVTLPNGAQESKAMVDVALANGKTVLFTRILTALNIFERDLKIERLNSQTGVVDATTLLEDVDASVNPLVQSKFLKNGDLSFICLLENTNNRYQVGRLNAQAGVLWQVQVQPVGPSGLNNQFKFCDAAIDESGNVCLIAEGSNASTTYGTSIKYVDNGGSVRWEQAIAPLSTSSAQDAINIEVDSEGKIYLGFQNVPIVNQVSDYSTSQLRLRQYQPALFMPVASDAKGTVTSHLYWSANENSVRLVRSGTPSTVANYTPGNAFRPVSIYTLSTGNALVLFSGTAAGAGRVATFSATSGIPSPITDFTLPANSGVLRDIAVDSSGRTWVTSNVMIGNAYYVKYHRLSIAGTSIDITRTLLVSSYASGTFGFEPSSAGFRFGSYVETPAPSISILTGSSSGAFISEYLPPAPALTVQDLRNTSLSKSFLLLSDKLGLVPGRYWRTNTSGTALDQDFELPWTPGLIPAGIGAVDNNNCRVIWHELGGKVHSRTMSSGSPGVITVLPAVMS